jgi:iron(III) transport system substrate-binding protein
MIKPGRRQHSAWRRLLPLFLTIFVVACGGPAAAPPAPAQPTAAPTTPAKPTAAPTTAAKPTAATTAPTVAAAPAASAPTANAGAATSGGVTQALIDAAKQEGAVVWYTAIELSAAEKVAKAFEAKYGVKVEVNRTGSERVMQRVMQEAQAKVKAVDVIHSADAGHFVLLKSQKMLAQYRPASFAKYATDGSDPDGTYFAWRFVLATPAYNPDLIKAEDAPKTWKDLLDPKWKGKMVSAHPGYSGNILTWSAALIDLYKTDYLDSLAKQDVMLVQSALDPVTKVTAGERALAINGSEYTFWNAKKKGSPVEAIYPTDGVPLATSPSAIAADAPHPNAAKLFHEYIFDLEAQQSLVDAGQYSGHPDVTYPPDRKKLSDLKILTQDENKLEQNAEQLKRVFTKAFGV